MDPSLGQRDRQRVIEALRRLAEVERRGEGPWQDALMLLRRDEHRNFGVPDLGSPPESVRREDEFELVEKILADLESGRIRSRIDL